MDLYLKKAFPQNYSMQVVDILKALSMTSFKHMELVGSSAIRSQLYSADFDCTEKVNASSVLEVASLLKDVIKRLRGICFINDIKIGEVPEWDVMSNFTIQGAKTKVDVLREKNIINEGEARSALALIDKANTPFGLIRAKKSIRWHILRWKPSQILEGVLHYRGHTFTLEEAILSGGMVKIDISANINNRFTEFSCIYDIRIKGKPTSYKRESIVQSLKEDIVYYNKINPFKAMKRFFALAKQTKDAKAAGILVPLMNSDLGRLYQIITDLETLHDLLERPLSVKEVELIKGQIDEIKARMGSLYELKDFLKEEPHILGSLEMLLRFKSLDKMKEGLYKLIGILQGILNDGTVKMAGFVVKMTDAIVKAYGK